MFFTEMREGFFLGRVTYFLLTIHLGFSWAHASDESYLSGARLFELLADHLIEPPGFFVPVPQDHHRQDSPLIDLYAFFPFGFDPARPTVVHVTGGPGFSAHDTDFYNAVLPYHEAGFNALLFDQRGLGFSRPNSMDQYQDDSMYTAVNTALDVEAIRKHLGLDVITISGASYGSAPAHYYAHLFPESTRALVMFNPGGDKRRLTPPKERFERWLLQISEARDYYQAIVASEPEGVVNAFQRYISDSAAKTGRTHLRTMAAGLNQYRDMLHEYAEQMKKFAGPKSRDPKSRMLLTAEYNAQPEQLIGPFLEAHDGYIHEVLWADLNNYAPENLPVSAPISVFAGTFDTSTPPAATTKMFRHLEAPLRQLILVKEAGHSVGRSGLRDPFGREVPNPHPIPQWILKQALLGQPIVDSAGDCESEFTPKPTSPSLCVVRRGTSIETFCR